MPIVADGLTEDERKHIREWLSEKLHECPSCKTTGKWALAGERVAFVGPSVVTMAQQVTSCYPAALVICNNCGYTQFHNTIVMGIDKPVAAEPE